jgi:hypothetical protein
MRIKSRGEACLVRTAICSALLVAQFAVSPLHAQESTSVGGYGELHYNEPDGSARGVLDLHRFVIYLGHSFTEKLAFKSEVEIEHTKIEATGSGGAEGGEVAVEQAYLDWHFSKQIAMKAGIILLPIGIVNQYHEPPVFNGVERPNVEDLIIPTTWRESGAGIYGSLSEGVSYQLYVVAGLKAEGFGGEQGIREGRQEALESSVINPSVTGRLEYLPVPELKLGGSGFIGQTTDGIDSLGSGTVTLLSGDAQYSTGRLAFRAVGAFTTLTDADLINRAYGNNVGENMYGYYAEGAYDILPFFCEEPDQALRLFMRYEKYNTQSKVGPSVSAANPAYDREDITVGTTYKPTYNTAFKCDYQFFNNAAGSNTKQFNLGIAYSF